MSYRNYQSLVFGTPKEFPSYGQFCDDIEEMIRTTLPAWHRSASNAYNIATEGEPKLASHLCGFLNQTARARSVSWQFNHQQPGEGGRVEDVTAGPECTDGTIIEGRVFASHERFYCFEAKRLPTPKGQKKKGGKKEDRTREYVCGDWGQAAELTKRICGGIERFKENHHGAGLTRGGMVAFIQSQPPQHWLGEVNGWIGDLVGNPYPWQALKSAWETGDALTLATATSSGVHTEYTSDHARGAGAPAITLRHFWIDLTVQPAAVQPQTDDTQAHFGVETHDEMILDDRLGEDFLPPLTDEKA